MYLCICAMMWRSESNFQDSVFFSYHMGPEVALGCQDWQQVPLVTEPLTSCQPLRFSLLCSYV